MWPKVGHILVALYSGFNSHEQWTPFSLFPSFVIDASEFSRNVPIHSLWAVRDNVGRILGIMRDNVGRILGTMRDNVGRILGTMRDNVGRILGTMRDNVGRVYWVQRLQEWLNTDVILKDGK